MSEVKHEQAPAPVVEAVQVPNPNFNPNARIDKNDPDYKEAILRAVRPDYKEAAKLVESPDFSEHPTHVREQAAKLVKDVREKFHDCEDIIGTAVRDNTHSVQRGVSGFGVDLLTGAIATADPTGVLRGVRTAVGAYQTAAVASDIAKNKQECEAEFPNTLGMDNNSNHGLPMMASAKAHSK